MVLPAGRDANGTSVRDGPGFTVLPTTSDGDTLFNWHRDYGPIVHPHATVIHLDTTSARRAA